MGYYTRYELGAEPWPDGLSERIKEAVGIYEELDRDTSSGGLSIGSSKWYDHEDHMAAVSRDFPGVLFTLRGEGEEAGDAWIKHFRDGRIQVRRAELVYPAYDPDGFK
jgi:hypothetical protein